MVQRTFIAKLLRASKNILTTSRDKFLLWLTLGRKGERIAAKYLKRKGYKIIDQNWRCPIGEIDIIAVKERTLFFIEVKTRIQSNNDEFQSRYSLNEEKEKQVNKLILEYKYKCSRKLKRLRIRNHRIHGIALTFKGGKLISKVRINHFKNYNE